MPIRVEVAVVRQGGWGPTPLIVIRAIIIIKVKNLRHSMLAIRAHIIVTSIATVHLNIDSVAVMACRELRGSYAHPCLALGPAKPQYCLCSTGGRCMFGGHPYRHITMAGVERTIDFAFIFLLTISNVDSCLQSIPSLEDKSQTLLFILRIINLSNFRFLLD